MDIANFAIGFKQMQVSYQMNLALMKTVMDNAQTNNHFMLKMLDANTKMMEQSVQPHLGGALDFRV
jgi:hypothetical protein